MRSATGRNRRLNLDWSKRSTWRAYGRAYMRKWREAQRTSARLIRLDANLYGWRPGSARPLEPMEKTR